MKRFEKFAAVMVAAGLLPISVQAQSPAPSQPTATPAQQVKQACGFTMNLNSAEAAFMRDRFKVSDRLTTRAFETEISDRAKLIDRCLDEVTKRVDAQAKQATPETVAAYRSAINQQRAAAIGEIRAVYAAYGYRPSSAAPGPRFGFCRIHDNFDPPQFDDYYNNYYVSAVFIDRDPEAEVPDREEFRPGTKAGQRVLLAMAAWITPRYKKFTSRDNQYCVFHMSANDAQKALDQEIEDRAIATGVQ